MIASLIVRTDAIRKVAMTICTVLVGAMGAILSQTRPARAEQVTACGGFAMLGGAQINCSHLAPKQPPQFCTFSWSLMTMNNTISVVQGAFVVPPGANEMTVYQGSGFNAALGVPVILCQGKKSR